MAKTPQPFDDEIDLIDLIRTFCAHKMKYVLSALLGLVIALIYSQTHEVRIETKFKISLGYPAFNINDFISSNSIQQLLANSELNPATIPHYSYNKKTNTFTVVTNTDTSLDLMVTTYLKEAILKEVTLIKKIASQLAKVEVSVIQKESQGLLVLTNSDIANLDGAEVVESLTVSFSEPKTLYPDPLKHGVIGLCLGLVLGFMWMLLAILVSQLKKQ